MREIKYRCFSKVAKKMYDWNWTKKLPLSELNINGDEYVFLQYTGLKDKNGKEICEGDIVRFVQLDKKTHFGKIEWDEKEAKFYPIGEGFCDYMGRLFSWKDLEVIGNIYENPDKVMEE